MSDAGGARGFVILGGGIVGLSVARELARRGREVTVLERSPAPATSGGATWASLGVLTAPTGGASAFKRLQRLGHKRFPSLAEELGRETGIDVGYRVRGSLHLKPQLPPAPTRARVERIYREAGLEAAWLEGEQLWQRSPRLAVPGGGFTAALHVPSEATVSPPDLARALRLAAEQQGAVVREGQGEVRVQHAPELEVVLESGEAIRGRTIVVTAGAWSRHAAPGGVFSAIALRPIRGQALEVHVPWPEGPNLRFDSPEHRREYHWISRGDGVAWLGSTVEDAGFEPRTTEAGIEELLAAGRLVVPQLTREHVARSWAGLRPQALRPGGPFLGRLPETSNAWVCCGHYRSGILTGPVSGELLVREMLEEPVTGPLAELDRQSLTAFRVER